MTGESAEPASWPPRVSARNARFICFTHRTRAYMAGLARDRSAQRVPSALGEQRNPASMHGTIRTYRLLFWPLFFVIVVYSGLRASAPSCTYMGIAPCPESAAKLPVSHTSAFWQRALKTIPKCAPRRRPIPKKTKRTPGPSPLPAHAHTHPETRRDI
jgi:hypothetical protein